MIQVKSSGDVGVGIMFNITSNTETSYDYLISLHRKR